MRLAGRSWSPDAHGRTLRSSALMRRRDNPMGSRTRWAAPPAASRPKHQNRPFGPRSGAVVSLVKIAQPARFRKYNTGSPCPVILPYLLLVALTNGSTFDAPTPSTCACRCDLKPLQAFVGASATAAGPPLL